MQLFTWLRQRVTGSVKNHRLSTPRPRQRRLVLEQLEDRTLPSTYYAANASDLIADINAANMAGGANTIVLTAPTSSPYVLAGVNNQTYGPTALPIITSGDQLTILTGNGTANPGYGDTLDAGKNGRLFAVASGGSLTLENVTLQNGYVSGSSGTSTRGGAIYNQGTLVLSQVMVHNNTARGQLEAAGGGIWSNGSLTVENSCVFQANSAIAPTWAQAKAFGGAICIVGGTANITSSTFGSGYGGHGNTVGAGNNYGSAYGGAVYVGGGTVTLNADTIGYNSAQGPSGPAVGGVGYGGGLCVAGGTVTLTNDYITQNVAGSGGSWGAPGYGGGIYIAPGQVVYLDSFTLAHTVYNNPSNIWGKYVLLT